MSKMSKHTPGPWTIEWYECVMDSADVEHQKSKGNLTAKVGDVLWRQPSSIGPCKVSNSHWGGDLLTVEEADARLIAAAPELLEALQTCESNIASLLWSCHPKVYGEWLNVVRSAIDKAI